MSKFTWFIAILLVFIAGVIVYNKILHPKEVAPKGPAGGPPKDMAVTGFVVLPKNLDNNIQASGTLLANEEIELHAEVAGKITQLNLNEGSAVSKGTLLVKLYDADLQAQLKKLQVQIQLSNFSGNFCMKLYFFICQQSSRCLNIVI